MDLRQEAWKAFGRPEILLIVGRGRTNAHLPARHKRDGWVAYVAGVTVLSKGWRRFYVNIFPR